MARMAHNDRLTCSVRLEPENSKFLDEEAARTGKSRSDIVNQTIRDYHEFWPKVSEIIEAQNALLLAFEEEVREIHKNRKIEHDQMLQLLEQIRKNTMFQNETTNP